MAEQLLTDDRQRAFDAVYFAIGKVFREFVAHKRELDDLPPKFWAALAELHHEADRAHFEEDRIAYIKRALVVASKQLGAPGDFGYGTPHGEALRNLYVAWRALPS